MRKMGGLKKYMPITFWCYFIGYLALSGFPLTAGFFSKDEVLLQTYHHNKLAWGLATFAAFLTAFYMTRKCTWSSPQVAGWRRASRSRQTQT